MPYHHYLLLEGGYQRQAVSNSHLIWKYYSWISNHK